MNKAAKSTFRTCICIALFSLFAAVCRAEVAAIYPSKSIKIVVPFPAGGTADIVARITAEKLRQKWKQPVIVENRPGAGGNIGTEAVASSAPDGYTLLVSSPGPMAINESLYKKLPFRPADLMPIAMLATVPNVLVVRSGFPAKSAQEFISYAKAHPGKVLVASQGNGTTSHLTAVMFQRLTATTMLHVPYRGTAPAMQDLMAGSVDVFFDNLGTSISLHQGGALRILAVCGTERVKSIPDIPTVSEAAGVRDFSSVTWFALIAAKGTPQAIAEKLNAAVADILTQEDVRYQLDKIGMTPAPMDASATTKFIADERERWTQIVRESGITIE
jgi:tripartite-type tricarboxylate transporter receptor subunit TctC